MFNQCTLQDKPILQIFSMFQSSSKIAILVGWGLKALLYVVQLRHCACRERLRQKVLQGLPTKTGNEEEGVRVFSRQEEAVHTKPGWWIYVSWERAGSSLPVHLCFSVFQGSWCSRLCPRGLLTQRGCCAWTPRWAVFYSKGTGSPIDTCRIPVTSA